MKRSTGTSTAPRQRPTSLGGDSMMVVIGVYGRIDWTVARLARARHPMLPAGDAYLRFMEEREAADLGALASTTSRHVVKRRKSRDTLTGDVVWTLSFHRPHAMFSRLNCCTASRARAPARRRMSCRSCRR